MTIQEQLNAINDTFVRLHKEFVRFEIEKKTLSNRFSLEYSRVQEKWDKERGRISAVKEDVLKYYRIAKDNSPKELIVTGKGGQRPDIARLNRMIEQINSCSRNDPIAGQIIDGSKPKTFQSQVLHYKEYEATHDLDDYEDSDILVYAGVPCSFNLARPFTLCNATAENILV